MFEIDFFRQKEKTVHFNTRVAGVSYEKRYELVRKMTLDTEVFLVEDPDNEYDLNAIKVMAVIDSEEKHIGFIPSQNGLAKIIKKHLEHGSKIVGVQVDKIYYGTYEQGPRYTEEFQTFDIKISLELNRKEIEFYFEEESTGLEGSEMDVLKLDKKNFFEFLKPYIKKADAILSYNREVYGDATFVDRIRYDKKNPDWWYRLNCYNTYSRKVYDLRILEEKPFIEVRRGLLKKLLEQLYMKVCFDADRHAFIASLELREGGDLSDYLERMCELNEDQAEVAIALLDENKFDYGYYNDNRGRELNEALDERFFIYENKDVYEKELQAAIKKYAVDWWGEPLEGECLEEFEDRVRTEAGELTIELSNGRLALIFYDAIEDIPHNF